MRGVHALLALLAMTWSAAAVAQGVPGMPPIRPLPDKEAVQVVGGALQLGAPAPAAPAADRPGPSKTRGADPRRISTPPQPSQPQVAEVLPDTDEVDEVRALGSLVESTASQIGGADTGIRPPAPQLTVDPGRNVMFAIARTHLNRLITPFPNPVVKSTAVATSTSIEGSVVYVATESPGPVAMFITDADDPVNAISLTLVPQAIPAVQVSIELSGYSPRRQRSEERIAGGEDPPYQGGLRELLRSLAQGDIPGGYSLQPLRNASRMPECILPGLEISPAQFVDGGDITVLVAHVRNTSMLDTVLDERMCAANGVLAVAAWPRVHLLPGQETELFIAMSARPVERSDRRPSTLTGGGW